MSEPTERATGSQLVKRGLAEMLKGGVIMDVVNPEQAKIAEDAGAVAKFEKSVSCAASEIALHLRDGHAVGLRTDATVLPADAGAAPAGEDDDPFTAKTIKQANPAYGVFQNVTVLKKMADRARRMPSIRSRCRAR